MPDTKQQRPEGALIAAAIDAAPGVSRRTVADVVGMSEARARQIINGYASAGRGQTVEVVAPAATLAKIALAVGLDEAELERAGRRDAADAMREQREARHGQGITLHTDRYMQAHDTLRRWLDDDGEDAEMHPPTDTLWLWTPRQLAENLAEQVALLEQAHSEAMTSYFHLLASGKQVPTDPEETPDAQPDSAPSTRAGGSPALKQDGSRYVVSRSVTPDQGGARTASSGPGAGPGAAAPPG